MGHLSVVRTRHRAAAVVAVDGEVDLATCEQLRDALTAAAADGPDLVVVDCSRLAFLDSSGLGVLAGARTDFSACGVRLVLANVPPRHQRLFHLTGLDRVISVHVQEAPAAARPWESAGDAAAVVTALGLDRPPVDA